MRCSQSPPHPGGGGGGGPSLGGSLRSLELGPRRLRKQHPPVQPTPDPVHNNLLEASTPPSLLCGLLSPGPKVTADACKLCFQGTGVRRWRVSPPGSRALVLGGGGTALANLPGLLTRGLASPTILTQNNRLSPPVSTRRGAAGSGRGPTGRGTHPVRSRRATSPDNPGESEGRLFKIPRRAPFLPDISQVGHAPRR